VNDSRSLKNDQLFIRTIEREEMTRTTNFKSDRVFICSSDDDLQESGRVEEVEQMEEFLEVVLQRSSCQQETVVDLVLSADMNYLFL